MSTDKTALGDRMKSYEFATKTVLPRRTYTVVRVDGRAFHTYLRGAEKPFDMQFISDMQNVAKHLCEEMSGTVFAYTQSDEISVLLQDFDSPGTQPWFNGEVQKIVSTAAALASTQINRLRPTIRSLPTFDARVFTISDPVEVANYFLWRQRDAVRNSVSMAAQAYFSHKQLHGKSGNEMQEMLFQEHGINWNDYPNTAKRGSVALKFAEMRTTTYTDKRTNEESSTSALRTWWECREAPIFIAQPDTFLANLIPSLPSLESVR